MAELLRQEDSLAPKVAKGGIWLFGIKVVERSLGLMRLIILARLLAPDDFGLFGIALLTISTLETLSQTGFQTALVQRKGDVTGYLDTAWTISGVRGIFLFTLLFLSAPYASVFFNSSHAIKVKSFVGTFPRRNLCDWLNSPFHKCSGASIHLLQREFTFS